MVNEPSHLAEPKMDQPYRWAREADPRAYLIVNDYHVLADGCPGFFRLLSAAKQHDVPFDGIGIQAHEPRTMRFPLDRVQAILNRYASLGKELHITEFTPTSAGQKITGPETAARGPYGANPSTQPPVSFVAGSPSEYVLWGTKIGNLRRAGKQASALEWFLIATCRRAWPAALGSLTGTVSRQPSTGKNPGPVGNNLGRRGI